MIRAIVNGRMTDCIDVNDRGLLYGDGLFETIAVVNGEPEYWPQHLLRLQAGCTRLGIESVDESLLAEECRQLLDGVGKAVVKLIITRGSGGRGYKAPGFSAPTRVLQLHEWPDFSMDCVRQGVVLRMCDTRLGHNPALAGIKHLNRLEQVLARQEWEDSGISEGLLLDSEGYLVEGTMSNLFLVTDDMLLTPDLQRCGVAGIMRSQLLEMAAELRIKTEVGRFGMSDLHEAQEVFICNSLIGIWPVIAIDDIKYTRGVITTRLQDMLASGSNRDWKWQK